MAANPQPETKVSTTGHEWDGIEELNHPLPRWWLWLFYITIVWAIGYTILYPAWPLVNHATNGLFGWNSRAQIEADLVGLTHLRGERLAALKASSLEAIEADQGLSDFARRFGKSAFADNCAGCHGAGAQGAKGFPNLLDDDWIWGGSLPEIYKTIQFGIRSGHDETRVGVMPAFVKEGVLKKEEAEIVADYVRSIAGLPVDAKADLARGAKIFADTCASCHGATGTGNAELGAPNLTDAIWLYGSDKETIVQGLTQGRGGVMPAWAGRLDEATVKALAVYVHGLGGGR